MSQKDLIIRVISAGRLICIENKDIIIFSCIMQTNSQYILLSSFGPASKVPKLTHCVMV